jgi:hypothetical protein
MKTLLSGLLLLMSLGLSGQDFKKLDEKNVDSKQKEFARKFASDYFSRQISEGTYQFKNDEATDDIVKFLTPEKQKEVYSQLKSSFGAYKSLDYSQTWMDSNSKVIIYRFKSLFGDSNHMEIRVVLNDKGKIAGFFIKPWAETLQ